MNRSRYPRWLGWLLLSLLATGPVVLFPASVRAQSVDSLKGKIEALEEKLKEFEDLKRQLGELKQQLRTVQKEQRAQKAKAEAQAKALGPIKNLKKTVEALSKIEISGNATGTVQSAANVPGSLGGDTAFAVGSFDLVFTHKPIESVKLVLDLEGIGGDGPDSKIPTLSGLNNDAGSTNDTVTALEAYAEATLFNKTFTLTAGKIDLTNYVDTNAFANDETSQFLSSAFVNNPVLSAPDNAAGIRGRWEVLPGALYLEAGAMNQDEDGSGRSTDNLFERVYGVWEVGFAAKPFGRKGNYRFWAFADGAGLRAKASGRQQNFTALGAGASIDQEITPTLGAFLRVGYRDPANLNFNTQFAWSTGLQLSHIFPGRKKDVLGVSYGEIRPTRRMLQTSRKNEGLLEAYYRIVLAEGLHISPLFQWVSNRGGNKNAQDVYLFGSRLQVDF